jgi:hypothetical protein
MQLEAQATLRATTPPVISCLLPTSARHCHVNHNDRTMSGRGSVRKDARALLLVQRLLDLNGDRPERTRRRDDDVRLRSTTSR